MGFRPLCVGMCAEMCVGMCVDMSVNMCVDVCVDMRVDMCGRARECCGADKCGDGGPQGHEVGQRSKKCYNMLIMTH